MTLRMVLVFGWILVGAVTIWAVATLGLRAAVTTFAGDLGHPWRAQFYVDLEVHLLLFAGWVVQRERSRSLGCVFAILTVLLGALFTLPYVLAASLRARGSVVALLLGPEAAEQCGRSGDRPQV